jgi:hypothetical protein
MVFHQGTQLGSEAQYAHFPEDFMFQLNDEEKQEQVTFCDRLGVLKHSGVNPKAFTQEVVVMLNGILN